MKDKLGFTLLEVLIVLAVLAGIIGMVALTFPGSQKRSRDSQRFSDLNQYKVALANYSIKNNGLFPVFPSSVEIDRVCQEIDTLECPDDPKDGWRYFYQSDSDGTKFVLWTALEARDYEWAVCSDGNSGVLVSEPLHGSCDIIVPEQPTATNTPTQNPNPPTSTPTNTPTPTPTNTPTPTPTPTPIANLVSNHSFELGKNVNWNFFTDGSVTYNLDGNASDGSNSARIDKTINNDTNSQLFQTNINMKPSKNYRLMFDARKDSGGSFSIYVHKHVSPFTNYGLNGFSVTPSTSWNTYSVDFQSTSSATNDARLRFYFVSSSVGRYFIDNVILYEL